MEIQLSEHYRCLKVFLQQYLQEQALEPRQARARDKLVRLTSIQFQELSTDVYDELLRREDEAREGGPGAPDNATPKYLLPKPNFHFKRNQARQKLSTLPHERFRQLATDVFYELERRFPRFSAGERSASRAGSLAGSVASGISGFGPPSRTRTPNGVPPRGDSRGPPMRNGPSFDTMSDYGRPLPKTYHSDTIVPNKGMMVEDDDASGPEEDVIQPGVLAEYQGQISALESKVGGLEKDLAAKSAALEKAQSSQSDSYQKEKNEWADLRVGLEQKLQDAQSLNTSLQSELERIRSENMAGERERQSTERDLRAQLSTAQQEIINTERTLRSQLDELRSSQSSRSINTDAPEGHELEAHRQITDEVRREAARHLEDMRVMAQQSAEALEKEERLLMRVAQLEQENKEWRDRHAKVKTQARSIRSSSQGLPVQSAESAARFARFMSPRGMVRDFHITDFQLGIDELMQLARKAGSDAALSTCAKQILISLRSISSDANLQSPALSVSEDSNGDGQKDMLRMKMRLSQAANNLLTATKTHIAAGGIAPVSLLDAAATNLTLAVVDLVRTVGVKQSSSEELEQAVVQRDNDGFVKPALPSKVTAATSSGNLAVNGANAVNHARNSSLSSNAYSNYSRYSRYSQSVDGEAGQPKGLGISADGTDETQQYTLNMRDWRDYLEESTSMLIQSIQPLVNTLRSGNDNAAASEPSIQKYISSISHIVEEVCQNSDASVRAAGQDESGKAIHKHMPPVISALEEARIALQTMAKDAAKREQAPPLAFKIARATKVRPLSQQHCQKQY